MVKNYKLYSPQIAIIIIIIVFSFNLKAQVYIKGSPYSKSYFLTSDNIPIFTFNTPNMDSIYYQDSLDELNGLLPRIGYPIPFNIDFFTKAKFDEMPNGDKIWRLKIQSIDAKSLSIVFDKFQINNKGKLYLLDDNYLNIDGPYCSLNNRRGAKIGGYKISLFESKQFIIEYNEPKDCNFNSIINISNIIYNYKDLDEFISNDNEVANNGDIYVASPCNVNINCPLGDDWQDEKKGVALVLIYDDRIGTGSLINNILNDGKLLFITAAHVVVPSNEEALRDNYTFFWNFESSSCLSLPGNKSHKTTGAKLLAYDYYLGCSDMALLELIGNPFEVNDLDDIYFNGFDLTGTIPLSSTCIHHPRGAIKKISVDDDKGINYYHYIDCPDFWKFDFDRGTVEKGSSGAPLFNNDNSNICSVLSAGSNSLDHCKNRFGIYYPLFRSWDKGDINTDLHSYLDPTNSGILVHNGGYFSICEPIIEIISPITTHRNINWVNIIKMSSEITSGVHVSASASEYVQLKPGFKSGQDFRANIKECAPVHLSERKANPNINNTNTSLNKLNSAIFFPNPFDTKLNINTDYLNEAISIDILNINGEKIFTHRINDFFNNEFELPSNISAGIYFIKIIKAQSFETYKIIKQ